jgi:molybdenum cofactor biosynthesis enzyme MoaA
MDTDSLFFLIDVAAENGLRQISLTGGDPTLHPKRKDIVGRVNSSGIPVKFFHTNGIALDQDFVDGGLDQFTKIAISPHAFEYDTWSKINVKGTMPQFEQMMENIHRLGKSGLKDKVEIKHVYVNGINSADRLVRQTLDICAEYGFKFKFLNFEPIRKEDVKLVPRFDDIVSQLESLGCVNLGTQGTFRGQKDYLPIVWFEYKGNKGVAIEIGCGQEGACRSCYKANEIYVTPSLELKPCHASDWSIPLISHIVNRNASGILEGIVKSREFLYTQPGKNAKFWNDHVKLERQ